jgi:hypothetical protein
LLSAPIQIADAEEQCQGIGVGANLTGVGSRLEALGAHRDHQPLDDRARTIDTPPALLDPALRRR